MRRLLCLGVLVVMAAAVRADDWPQWLGPQRDGIWREAGIVDKFPAKGLTAKWRTPLGAGYAGPAVADGKVYVMDRILDKGTTNPKNPFGRDAVNGTDRIVCLDAATGQEVWKHSYPSKYEVSYPAGPRTTPVVSGGKVYALGTMGELFCLDAAKGTVLWSKNFPKDYDTRVPTWGWSASPLLDGNRLICIVGGKGSVAVAFDKDTGKEVWKALSADEPGYCPPMIYQLGGKRQLIIWHPEAVNGLDPETGKVYWTQPFKVRSGLSIPTPRVEGDRLFVSSFYNGSLMLQFDKDKAEPRVLWKGKSNSEQPKRTDGLHAIMTTPFLKDGMIYGVCSYGELRGLKEDSGERVWESLQLTGSTEGGSDRWNNAFLVAQGDRFFCFTEKGDVVIARLTPKGYEEISRANILKPDNRMPGRPVIWSHPAFANKCIFARNDSEIVCVPLGAE
jgi:outer membrane protein assembly factor BamB